MLLLINNASLPTPAKYECQAPKIWVTSLCQGFRRSAGSGGEDPENQVVITSHMVLTYVFLRDHHSAGMVIAGDLNKLNLSSLCCQSNSLRKAFKAPTRGRSVLDKILALTNMFDSYEQVQHRPPTSRSDYQTLLLKPKIKEKTKPIVGRIRQMKPENIRSLDLKLNLECWDAVFDASDVDEKQIYLLQP